MDIKEGVNIRSGRSGLGPRVLSALLRWYLSQDQSGRSLMGAWVKEKLQGAISRYASRLRSGAVRMATILREAMADPAVPARAKAAAVCALLYFVFPVDLVPDLLPGGLADDAAVLAAAAVAEIISAHRAAGRQGMSN